METKILLGKRIRRLRRLKDYSQEQLAEKANISGKYLGEIERGLANISIEVLEGISKGLEIDLSSLLDLEHESDRKELISKITLLVKEADDRTLRVIFRVTTSILK